MLKSSVPVPASSLDVAYLDSKNKDLRSFAMTTQAVMNDQSKLEEAAQLINTCLSKDERLPPLGQLLFRHPTGGTIPLTTSSLTGTGSHKEYLFQNGISFSDSPTISPAIGSYLKLEHITVIPQALLTVINENTELPLFMGLLASISRAWLAIGDHLYIWSYSPGHSGSDLTCFPISSNINVGENSNNGTREEVIIDVSLAHPKVGVFVDKIEYVFIVTTVQSVHLLGMSLQDQNCTLTLHKTGFVFDCSGILSVTSSLKSGRIFVAGQDGHIYELDYSASSDSGFNKLSSVLFPSASRCKKINRTGSNSFAYLVPNFMSSKMPVILAIAVDDVRNILFSLDEAGVVSSYSLVNDSFNPLAQIDLQRSTRKTSYIGLSIIDQDDLNCVVFAADGVRIYLSLRGSVISSAASLVMIGTRVAPEDPSLKDPRQLVLTQAGPQLQLAQYHSGGFFVAVWQKTPLEDSMSFVGINYACAFNGGSDLPIESCYFVERDLLDGKLWDIQIVSPESSHNRRWHSPLSEFDWFAKVVVLSNSGVYTFSIQGPVNIVKRLIDSSGGVVSFEPIKQFFTLYSPPVAMAACLQVAFQLEDFSITPGTLLLWCKSMIAHYACTLSPQEEMKQRSPPQIAGPTTLGRALPKANNPFPAILMGVYLFSGRLIKHFWNLDCQKLDECTLASQQSAERSLELSRLLQFLNGNPALWHVKFSNISILDQVEKLKLLIQRVLELSNLFSIASDYRILCSGDLLPYYGAAYFGNIVISNPNEGFIRDLLDRLVAKQLKLQHNAGVDPLCAILRQRCPSLFKQAQVGLYEGVEYLERAKRSRNFNEAQECLEQAETCFSKAAMQGALTRTAFDKLFAQLEDLKAFNEMTSLAMSFSKAIDPSDSALASYLENSVVQSGESASHRLHAYECIIQHCLIPLTQAERYAKQRSAVISRIASSSDELLQVKVFDWVFTTCYKEQLLLSTDLVQSRYLENYLIQHKENPEAASILWRYYAKNERNLEAAQVLGLMVQDPRNQLVLKERIEALSRAVVLARSARFSSTSSGPLASELEDRLEVALIQLELLESTRITKENEELQTSLLGLSDLFNKYAKPLGRWETCLRILQCAGHYDTVVIGDLWRHLLIADSEEERLDLPVLSQRLRRLLLRFGTDENLVPMRHILDLLLNKFTIPSGWLNDVFFNNPSSEIPVGCKKKFITSLMDMYDCSSHRQVVLDELMFAGQNPIIHRNPDLRTLFEERVLTLSSKYPVDWKTKLKNAFTSGNQNN